MSEFTLPDVIQKQNQYILTKIYKKKEEQLRRHAEGLKQENLKLQTENEQLQEKREEELAFQEEEDAALPQVREKRESYDHPTMAVKPQKLTYNWCLGPQKCKEVLHEKEKQMDAEQEKRQVIITPFKNNVR